MCCVGWLWLGARHKNDIAINPTARFPFHPWILDRWMPSQAMKSAQNRDISYLLILIYQAYQRTLRDITVLVVQIRSTLKGYSIFYLSSTSVHLHVSGQLKCKNGSAQKEAAQPRALPNLEALIYVD
jgi:hypothetical protein